MPNFRLKQALLLLYLIILPVPAQLLAQEIRQTEVADRLRNDPWPARWIKTANSVRGEQAVYLFRNSFKLDKVPAVFRIHITADQHYRFFVNGNYCGEGPAAGDPYNWFFETYDLAPLLSEGTNYIAVEIWNNVDGSPDYRMSAGTAFLFQADQPENDFLNTPGSWLTIPCTSIKLSAGLNKELIFRQTTVGKDFPWGWKEAGFDDRSWLPAEDIGPAGIRGYSGSLNHALLADPLKPLHIREDIEPTVFSDFSIKEVSRETGGPVNGLHLEGNKKYVFKFDLGKNVVALPFLKISGGKDSKITLSGFADDLTERTDQNSSQHTTFSLGILPDGESQREYSPLEASVTKYYNLEIETGNEDLTIESFHIMLPGRTEVQATFSCPDEDLQEGWNNSCEAVALLDGDVLTDDFLPSGKASAEALRKNSLAWFYQTADLSLVQKVILDFYHSLTPEGLTLKNYPTQEASISPYQSLDWIESIYDYLWHAGDDEFVFSLLIPVQNVISWFEYRIDPQSGMLNPLEYEKDSEKLQASASAISSLRFAYSLRHAAELFNYFGYADIGRSYSSLSDSLCISVTQSCWDEERNLFADNSDKKEFSQLTQVLAVLTGCIPPDRQALFLDQAMLAQGLRTLAPGNNDYLFMSLLKSGLGNKISASGILSDYSKQAFTDRCQKSYMYLAGLAGIRPGNYGFSQAIIEPHPGPLSKISASMPTGEGTLSVDLEFSDKGAVRGTIVLPGTMSGIFIWYGQVRDLKPGRQFISIQNKF